jgi:4-alpha-glucanotransferase
MSDDEAIRDLARAAGIAVEWINAAKEPQVVSPAALVPILAALGFPCETRSQLTESRERIAIYQNELARLTFITATAGEPVSLRDETAGTAVMLELESGTRIDLPLRREGNRASLSAPSEPGYHRLHLGERTVTLAVAPPRCLAPVDLVQRPRSWGIAVQLYALRHRGDLGIGNAGGLIALCEKAAQSGADAIALSPTHAMFSADPKRYAPYSPSSRLFFNPLYADPNILFGEELVRAAMQELGLTARSNRLESADLIDWPRSSAAKQALLRTLFDAFWKIRTTSELGQVFKSFRARGGALLEKHARFEALHAFQGKAAPESSNWRAWPRQWRDPDSEEVSRFSYVHAREIAFHIFLQWVVDASLATAQHRARSAGMGIGLIADMAIGMDAAGSHAWSQQRDLVVGLNVGAPPDLFNARGQDWGLTTFSPQTLAITEFGPFLATVRAVLRNAGGVRIDHAMGLTRLWLVPEGAPPAEGAYLKYPSTDLMRLLRLESHRHRAIIIAEDLGTVPEGFQDELMNAGIYGMRVLWFEREDGAFRPPPDWDTQAAAMTTTHDLPTVAGWWRGADIEARLRCIGPVGTGVGDEEKRQRETDRDQLWEAFRAAGATHGEASLSSTEDVVDAAVRYVADTPSELALLPIEDLLGMADQPNLPGTTTEHPNWRRRYSADASALCGRPEVARRTGLLRERRGR